MKPVFLFLKIFGITQLVKIQRNNGYIHLGIHLGITLMAVDTTTYLICYIVCAQGFMTWKYIHRKLSKIG